MTPSPAAHCKSLRRVLPHGRTAELARRWGVARRHLRGIASGERPAGVELAVRIASDPEFRGLVSLEELLSVSIPSGVAVRASDVQAPA